jgi:hypothetical protein
MIDNDREARIRQQLQSAGLGLLKRQDGYFHITQNGEIRAPNGWRVGIRDLNDRGGKVGSAYPLTLGWIEFWLQGNNRYMTS